MLFHQLDPKAEHMKLPATAWNKDGLDWHTVPGHSPAAFEPDIELDNGEVVHTLRRERHQLLVDDEGEPQVLFNGVTVGDHGYSFTTAQPIRTDKAQKLLGLVKVW